MSLRDTLVQVRDRIHRAADAAGRAPDSITLVAVTKTHPAETVREAAAAGLRDIGENKVQEAAAKIAALSDLDVRWHLIGHLQSNKAGKAVELFDLIHSIDSVRLAAEVGRRAAAIGRRQRVLLQVNCSGEESKSGCAPEDLPELAREAFAVEGLAVEGLMTIGVLDPDPESARPAFRMLRRLRDDAEQALGRPLPHLSMGMTGDLEVAIEEGATLIRVGTALFGERPIRR